MARNWRLYSMLPGAMLVLLLVEGCICEFDAYRNVEEARQFRMSDTRPHPLPLFAPGSIEVYWDQKGAGGRRVGLPDRPYEVVGLVEGAAGFAWQWDWVIEGNFRRAVVALEGDAAIHVKRSVFTGAYPANEFYGEVVRWKNPEKVTDAASE